MIISVIVLVSQTKDVDVEYSCRAKGNSSSWAPYIAILPSQMATPINLDDHVCYIKQIYQMERDGDPI